MEEYAKAVADGTITEEEAASRIQARGVDFLATPENLERLRRAGASDAFLDLIRKLAPEPAPPPTATLSLVCQPAECNIRLNGQLAGSTQGGQWARASLPVGEITVNFEKDGYITQQKVMRLTAGAAPPVSVTLEATNATREAFGKELFRLTRRTLGVEADLKPYQSITGAGSATSYAAGKQSDWNFDFATAPPNLIEMKMESPNGVLVFQCKGERCLERKKGRLPLIGGGKQVKGAVLEELQANLRAFAQYNLADVLEEIGRPTVHLESATADANSQADQHLRAESADSVYAVTIDRDLLPSIIDYQSKSGLGSGLKVSFGDYTTLGDAKYPKRTTIRLPDAGQHGIEVRLDKVTPGSELKASDFPK